MNFNQIFDSVVHRGFFFQLLLKSSAFFLNINSMWGIAIGYQLTLWKQYDFSVV